MNGSWIHAGGFENVLPFIILALWIVGKVMNARAEARSRKPPADDEAPAPFPRTSRPDTEPAPSGEEQLRRFLADLTGDDTPPPAPPPALPEPPPLPEFRPSAPVRPPMRTFMTESQAAPGPMSLRQKMAERRRLLRTLRAAPPPVPVPVHPAPTQPQQPYPEYAAPTANAALVTMLGPQARTAVMPASGMQGITMAGPNMGSIGRLSALGRAGSTTWAIRPLLGNRRRLKEAMILRTILAPPRALDPL